MEEWRPFPGFEGRYEISSEGRVRSVKRKVRSGRGERTLVACILTVQVHYQGYRQIILRRGGKCIKIFIHRAVADAFLVNIYSKPYVNHIDRDKENNAVHNLEWVTEKENTAHWMAHDREMARSPVAADPEPFPPEDLPF